MTIATSQLSISSEQNAVSAILQALALIQKAGYGSIEITVHDGRVTQIERREKLRFESKSNSLNQQRA